MSEDLKTSCEMKVINFELNSNKTPLRVKKD
jgi:hypothetical protein